MSEAARRYCLGVDFTVASLSLIFFLRSFRFKMCADDERLTRVLWDDKRLVSQSEVASLQRAGERFSRDVHAARGEGLGGHG